MAQWETSAALLEGGVGLQNPLQPIRLRSYKNK